MSVGKAGQGRCPWGLRVGPGVGRCHLAAVAGTAGPSLLNQGVRKSGRGPGLQAGGAGGVLRPGGLYSPHRSSGRAPGFPDADSSGHQTSFPWSSEAFLPCCLSSHMGAGGPVQAAVSGSRSRVIPKVLAAAQASPGRSRHMRTGSLFPVSWKTPLTPPSLLAAKADPLPVKVATGGLPVGAGAHPCRHTQAHTCTLTRRVTVLPTLRQQASGFSLKDPFSHPAGSLGASRTCPLRLEDNT